MRASTTSPSGRVRKSSLDHGRPCEPLGLDLTPDGFDQGEDARPDPHVTRVGGRSEGRQGLAAEALQSLVGRHAVVERFGAQPPDQRDRVGRVVGSRRREHESQQAGCEHGRTVSNLHRNAKAVTVSHSRRRHSNHGRSPNSRKIPAHPAVFLHFFDPPASWEVKVSEPNRTPRRPRWSLEQR